MAECSILTSDTEVFALAEQWRTLQKSAGRSVFTDYDWFKLWWRMLGNQQGRRLHIITARENGQLSGVLPLAVTRRKGFRVLQGIGAEAFYFCDTLCNDIATARALWQAAKNSPHYDFAHIRDVCPDSMGEQALSSFATLHDRDKNHVLRLEWRTLEDWKMRFLSAKRRAGFHKKMRALEATGPVRYQIFQGGDLPTSIIRDMVAYKTAWCVEHGMQGMFDQPAIGSFFEQLAQHLQRNHTLVLGWLSCAQTVIAYHLMFSHGKTLYSYVMAFDPAWEKYSPGILANTHAIGWAIDNGFEYYDHLQGDFAYKIQFANQARECREYMFHNSLRGWLGEQLFVQKRRLKRALAKKS